ncbi:hypothetical protein AL755_03120 (plasmid) [Arthrobacter sp. ERGS1:01]|nr:hypothetical protein AL755_03120 [Arthrobacter sp. ERGS1:01]
MWRRAELIEKAIEHHLKGAYEASIPILYAQAEGLAYDATGKPFFTKSSRHYVAAIDDTTLAGLDGNLEVARVLFSDDVSETQDKGSLSRHGILHGRELAYDTEVVSTKALVLVLSLAEHWEQLLAKVPGFED